MFLAGFMVGSVFGVFLLAYALYSAIR